MADKFFNAKKAKEMKELEKTLECFISPEMSTDTKIKVLENSFWRAHHAGYCDYMAGQRMAGVDDGQVYQHDLDCKYKYEVERLLEILHEFKSDVYAEDWQRAEELLETDSKAAFEAWLELFRRGYARASNTVGWCYRTGSGVDANLDKAIEYYKLSVDGGYAYAYNGLYWTLKEAGRQDEAINALLCGAGLDDAACFEALAAECGDGNAFGGNSRVAAYLATRAYELDEECGSMLGYYYVTGRFFPVVYSYAKYCFEQSNFTREGLEAINIELPEFWDAVEPVKPQYPDFGLTLDTCEGAVDPEELVRRAEELMFADQPDNEAAKPYIREAVAAGMSRAMYYSYFLDIEGCEDMLINGANKYGDLDCIDLLAKTFSDFATYKIGNIYLTNAIRYWNMRKRLHSSVPMAKGTAEAYERYSDRLDRMLGRKEQDIDRDANAIKLTFDGSFERVKVDFSSLEGLRAPLDCERVNAISTEKLRGLSDKLGFTVVMYCDERGMMKHLNENVMAADLSGYEVIFGDVIICGFKDDYAPLYKDELDEVWELLEAFQ
ncbi:MAG: hypothetical protein E7667_06020 [Ruminococcaceae bacterium]|nr:hypothetical protein [Oscillospiraceae bacterium]